MLEKRSEKILLTLVLVLVGALVLEPVVLRPLSDHLMSVDGRIAELREKLAQAKGLGPNTRGTENRVFRAESLLGNADVEGQNEIRQYLSSIITAEAEVKTSKYDKTIPMEGAADLKLMTFTLTLEGSMDQLREVLEKLDQAQHLLRVEDLKITNTLPRNPLLTLEMVMTISVIARAVEEKS